MNKNDNIQKQLVYPKVVGLLVVIILFIITAVVSTQKHHNFQAHVHSKILTQLDKFKVRFESEINRDFYLIKGLMNYVSVQAEFDSNMIQRMSENILQDSFYIKSIALAPDNVLTFVYPPEYREHLLEIEYNKNSQPLTMVKSIVEVPTILEDGTKALFFRLPIYSHQATGHKDKYWGFIEYVFAVEQLCENLGLNESKDFTDIALKKENGKGQDDTLIYGVDTLDSNKAVMLNIDTLVSHWVLSGEPNLDRLESAPNYFMIWFLGITFALLSGWLVYLRLEIASKRKSDLEAALKQARLADKVKSDFVANMSHEMRTPLNPIISLTYLALKDEIPTQTRNYLKEIQSASQMLLKIIDSVLDFSKIQANKLTLEKQRFCMDQFLTNLANIYDIQAQDKNLSFSIQAMPNVPSEIVGDAMRLEQILGNLLNNAIKFTTKGEITLKVQVINRSENKVAMSFEIEDTGIGMTAEQSQYLFQEYTQSDSSITREYGGTGLGLSICQRLIHLMGGEIFVESKSGEGTQLSFYVNLELPDNQKDSDNQAYDSEQAQQLPTYQGESLLLVEDNITNLVVIQKLLKGTGLKISIANNGQEAVSLCEARKFDIILMDIQMPLMDGYQAVEKIHQIDYYKQIPIIAMTAHALKGDRQKSLTAGMSDHMTKPIDPELFYQTLMHWLPATGTTPHKATNTTENLWSLDDLPGVDTTVGLKKFLQDQELYQKVLLEFYQDHQADADDIIHSIKNKEIDHAQRLVHTLKGAASHLGAKRLYQATLQLETALINEIKQDEPLCEFQLALDEVLCGIAKLEKKYKLKQDTNPKKNTVTDSEINAIITEMAKMLKQASPQASELVPQLSEALDSEYASQINNLKEKVDEFDFDEALNSLNQIQEKINKN